MVFILKNNLDKREFTFEVTDKVSSSLFYTFDINLPEGISDGEYTYYLKVNDKVVSKGICIVGDYNLDITKYEEEKGVEYYVYDGDSDNVVAYVDTKAKPEQSKSLSVEKNGSYEITPDSGLVLNKVDISVDVQPTPTQSKSETYVSNGSYSVTPDEGYNLSKVDIDVNVPSGNELFKAYVDGSLTTIKAEDLDGVTKIKNSAFYNCTSLTSVTLPSSVTSIGDLAFNYCTSLTSVTLPSSVTKIGYYAVYNCSSLTSITCLATTPPSIYSDTFYTTTCTIYVPSESLSAYKNARYWSDMSSRIQAITE